MDKDLKKVSTDESCKVSALRKAHKWGVEEVESRESFWFLKKLYLKNKGMCMVVEVQWITEKKKGKLLLHILDSWGGVGVYTRARRVLVGVWRLPLCKKWKERVGGSTC